MQLADRLPAVAAEHGLSAAELRRDLRADHTLWVDQCGALFYVEPPPEPTTSTTDTPTAESAPLEDTFTLHSKPGSQRVIYLDFDGHSLSNTAWNAAYKLPADYGLAAYDTDGAAGTFSDSERAVIQSIWQRVAEDYAPFDVDVTTQDPGADAITRSSSADVAYGTRVAVTGDRTMYDACKCGGMAYVGTFDLSSSHAYYQPALVFTLGVSGAKNIAEAASHEAGHNLGLSHDGTVAHDGVAEQGYYRGHGAWAPIMGAGYSKAITQWSRGEYSYANNGEDDFSVMASNGAPPRTDDHGGTPATATAVVPSSGVSASGVVSSSSDRDVFSFAAHGDTQISANPASVSPNLDVRLELLDVNGNLVQVSDPPSGPVTGDVASGLNAMVSTTLTKGTYYLVVEGTGYGDPLTTGYSRYASLGTYDVSLQTGVVEITTATLPTAYVGGSFSAALSAVGGTAPITWELASGALPEGMSLNANGTVTGTPLIAATTTFTVRAIDAIGRSATSDVTFQAVIAPPDAPLVSVAREDKAFVVSAQPPDSTRSMTGVRVSLDGVEVVDTTDSLIRLGDLTPGQEYEVEVVAYGLGGDSPPVVSHHVAIGAPAPLTVLGVVAGASAGSGRVQLNWHAVASTDAQPLTGYRIYQDGLAVSTTTATTATVDTLTNGQSYLFEVRPYGPAGEGAGRSESATPTTPPPTVESVNMTLRDRAVALSWPAVTSTSAAPVAGYRVLLDGVEVANSNETEALLDSLVAGQQYDVAVEAYGPGGDAVPAETQFVAVTTPSALSSVSATAGAGVGSGSVRLTWQAVASTDARPIHGYRIYTGNSPAGDTTGTTFDVRGLTNGEVASFEVRPYGPAGEGMGATVSATPVAPPAAVSGISVTRRDGSADVTWSPVAATAAAPVTGYRLLLDGVQVADGSQTSAQLPGLVPGRTYEVKVVAHGSGGAAGPTINRFVAIGSPDRPDWLKATTGAKVGPGTVRLQWDPASSSVARPLSGYRIYRNGTHVKSTTDTTSTFTGLRNGSSYRFEIRPYGPVGDGPGRAASATPVKAPPSVTKVTMARRARGVRLRWPAVKSTAAAPVRGYRVYRGTRRVYQGSDLAATVRTVGFERQSIRVVVYGRGGASAPYRISARTIRLFRSR